MCIAIGCIRRNTLWVYIAIGCVMLHSDALALWVYIRIGYIMRNAVGTAHMLKTKPVVLWVHNASYIVGVFRKTTTAVTLASVRERLEPLFCTVASEFNL